MARRFVTWSFNPSGAVRFVTKVEGGPATEDGERYYNYVRLARGSDVTETPECDSTADDTSTGVSSSDDALNAPPEGQLQQVTTVRI